MLLTFKEDNTTGSFYLCHLLCVLSVSIKVDEICRSVHLCTIIKCPDGMAVYMCPCTLLVIVCEHYWLYVCQLQYADICGYFKIRWLLYCCSCLIISLHPPSYNIVKMSFWVAVWCLTVDKFSLLLHRNVINMLECLFVCLWFSSW